MTTRFSSRLPRIRRPILLAALAVALPAALPSEAAAQYFGRNKVQYEKFDWYVVQTERFDVRAADERERADHTLQPTALVHEAYMRLTAQKGVEWRNREHFLGIAAAMMRRVLVDHARGHRRGKRGGGLKLPLADADGYAEGEVQDLVALDEALRKLARKHPQKSRVVELRFFGGLSIEETAGVLKVSDSTIERDWKFARAWLAREIDPGGRYE